MFLIVQEINDVGNCQSIVTIVIVNGEIVTGEADACRPPSRLFFPSQENPRGGQEEIRLLHLLHLLHNSVFLSFPKIQVKKNETILAKLEEAGVE